MVIKITGTRQVTMKAGSLNGLLVRATADAAVAKLFEGTSNAGRPIADVGVADDGKGFVLFTLSEPFDGLYAELTNCEIWIYASLTGLNSADWRCGWFDITVNGLGTVNNPGPKNVGDVISIPIIADAGNELTALTFNTVNVFGDVVDGVYRATVADGENAIVATFTPV
jgi:hypothetical protein